MALLSDVMNILDNYKQAITLMNQSDNELETKKIAMRYSNIHAGINWGNCLSYLDDINEYLVDISLYAGTPSIRGVVENFNIAIERLTTYLATHWWQFGSSDRPQIAELPSLPLLV